MKYQGIFFKIALWLHKKCNTFTEALLVEVLINKHNQGRLKGQYEKDLFKELCKKDKSHLSVVVQLGITGAPRI